MEIAILIAGYFTVGFVGAVVSVCCEWPPCEEEWFIPMLSIFVWPVLIVGGLFYAVVQSAVWLGERCRVARERRREKA